MGRPKKIVEGEPIEPKEEVKEEVAIQTPPAISEKEELEIVYKFCKDRGLNSIGDIENKIARL